ncbi:Uncharacterised protein [Citrobacter amalonaticus]|nr:Uncharacterised protein [Citrobacter amalonaticus]
MRRKCYRTRVVRTFGKHHVDHLRNNIASTANYHLIANAQAKTFDFIGIMQRGVTHQHTRDLYRFKTRNGSNCSGASDLELHVTNKGHLFLRREFKGTAQRGARATKPSCSCSAIELTLITTPSMSKPSVGRSSSTLW